jgi:hypothetical protein
MAVQEHFSLLQRKRKRDSSVSIATGYGLDNEGSIPGRVKIFSLLHSVQTSSGAHPASHPMGTEGSFSEGKAAKKSG